MIDASTMRKGIFHRVMETSTAFTLLYVQYVLGDVSPSPVPSTAANPRPQGLEYNLLSVLCVPGVCRNGQCYLRNEERLCYCQSLFRGKRCEFVDMDQVTYAVIGSVVIFQWPRPPRLKGYSFVYYELDKPDSFINRRDIVMEQSERAALVGSLNGGYTTYRICIEDVTVADVVVNQNSKERLSNCINLTTQPDYHTMAAWCIAAMLVCVAILLIYWQKDKFELLYFSKPVFLMYEQEADDKGSQNSLQRTPHVTQTIAAVANRMLPRENHVTTEVVTTGLAGFRRKP